MGDRYQPRSASRYGGGLYQRDRYDRGADGREDYARGQYDQRYRFERSLSPRYRPSDRYRERYGDRSDGQYNFRGAASSRDDVRPQHAFTFRANGAPAPKFPPQEDRDDFALRGADPRRPQESRQGPGSRGQPSYGRGDRMQRGRGRPRYKPPAAHSRNILQSTHRGGTPEQLSGMNVDHQAHFVDVESSDDESADGSIVDLTKDSGDEQDERSRKRTKTAVTAASASATPKWSNPDPYTALPPPETLGAPKKDIVQVIRKAKVDSAYRSDSNNAVKDNIDFIAFSLNDDLSEGEVSEHSSSDADHIPPQNAPDGLSAMTRGDEQDVDSTNGFQHSRSETLPYIHDSRPANVRPEDDVWPPPPPPNGLVLPSTEELAAHYSGGNVNGLKRKREEQALDRNAIVPEWRPNGNITTPWFSGVQSPTASASMRLDKEIVDFFAFVRPYDYEEAARRDLIDRVQRTIRNQFMHPGAREVEIKSFGSFAAGLYLPVADMDLVAVSPGYMKHGAKSFCQTKSKIHKLGGCLVSNRIAAPGTMTAVVKARVPIVKLTDDKTRIKVDISFESKSGINANATVQAWKAKHPAMPYLVVLIKQLLAMRGLNEVFNGGLGGFSIICLVVNMLEMLPELQSASASSHYGALLLEFLNLYGNKFDIKTVGITMNPPSYFSKINNPRNSQNNQRLTIIDPNDAQNDISGGTREINSVLQCFRHVHAQLQRRLAQVDSGEDEGSILGCIWGGNYSSFLQQREYLSMLHRGVPASPPLVQKQITNQQRKPRAPKKAKKPKVPQRQQSGGNHGGQEPKRPKKKGYVNESESESEYDSDSSEA